MSKGWPFLAMGFMSFLVGACGGSDVTGPNGGGGGNGGGTPPASFSQDVHPIFIARGCTAGNCHGGGSGGLTLTGTASANYTSLVNVPASANSAFLRVEPNDATNSYLIMKVEGRAGSRMPIGGAPLSSSQIQTMRSWIDSGAPSN